jgi:two-component system response regulator VicR
MEESVIAPKTILVVDDEQPIVDILVYNLQKEGYKTLEAYDGLTAVEIAVKEKPNLILLDIQLPRMDGLTACKKIRHTLNVPILMLTAKDEEIDKILGLELGADDYITKPFSVRELMARIKANLRKVDASMNVASEDYEEVEHDDKKTEPIIKLGSLVLNLSKFEAKIDGKIVDLTLREFEVLKFLSTQPNKVVTRETLLEKVC